MKDRSGPTIEEIAGSSVIYRSINYGPWTTVQVALAGYNGWLCGDILGEQATVQHFSVDDDYKENGFGRRLVEAFSAQVKDDGARELTADLISHAAIAVFTSLFGDALKFSINEVHCTIEEAKAYVPGDERTVHISVDLAQIDTNVWERPVVRL